MTQIATVTGLPASAGGPVELTIHRQSACGHDCGSCGGCGAGGKLVVRAETEIALGVGDRVEVYSDNRVLGIAALVYGLPVILFLLGYLLPASLPEGARYLCGGLGFLLGLAAAVLCDRLVRRGKGVGYHVARKL